MNKKTGVVIQLTNKEKNQIEEIWDNPERRERFVHNLALKEIAIGTFRYIRAKGSGRRQSIEIIRNILKQH